MTDADGPPRSPGWDDVDGPARGLAYEARFARRAASGLHVHGEADLCAVLTPPGAVILDAGCGTGRVALELSRRGYRCVGMDRDESMLARARAASAAVTWVSGDLADARAVAGLGRFDLVVAAGNVVPLLATGTEAAVLASLGDRLGPGGRLVTGFGLDPAHLPLAEAPFGLHEYDRWCAAAGLALVDRWASWDRAPYSGGGYAVNVHRSADSLVVG